MQPDIIRTNPRFSTGKKNRPLLRSIYGLLVPEAGIEPARPLFRKAADFKSAVSTNFTTRAFCRVGCFMRAGEIMPAWLNVFAILSRRCQKTWGL